MSEQMTPERKTRKREVERMRVQNPEVKARKAEQMRGYRKTPEIQARNHARRKIRTEIEAGRLKRENCSICGSRVSEAHHQDYSKPLEVVWLCFSHHAERHRVMRDQGIKPYCPESAPRHPGIRGVFFHKARSEWRAHITRNRKYVHLGAFRRIEDAIAARAHAEMGSA